MHYKENSSSTFCDKAVNMCWKLRHKVLWHCEPLVEHASNVLFYTCDYSARTPNEKDLLLSLVRRPLELQYKYGNLSKGDCKPGYAEAKMSSIYPK